VVPSAVAGRSNAERDLRASCGLKKISRLKPENVWRASVEAQEPLTEPRPAGVMASGVSLVEEHYCGRRGGVN